MTPFIFTLALIGVLIGGSFAFARQTGVFTLKNVTVDGFTQGNAATIFEFAGLSPGESLFEIDLQGVEEHVRKNHPEYQDIRVRRVLPNEINIGLTHRIPMSQVHFDKYYAVDNEAVILSISDNPLSANYPLIRGVKKPRNDLKLGSHIESRPLEQALDLLLILKREGTLRSHQLTYLDISDARNFILQMDGSIEIRMGSRNFSDKLMKLKDALKNLDIDAAKVRYLDLRFDDIVVGPR